MRLIDADKLEEHKFTSSEANHNDMGGAYRTGWNDAIDAICDNAPTVDAVEVVRCRECKWWWKEWETCTHNNLVDGYTCATTFKADEYCSYGEKKDEID